MDTIDPDHLLTVLASDPPPFPLFEPALAVLDAWVATIEHARSIEGFDDRDLNDEDREVRRMMQELHRPIVLGGDEPTIPMQPGDRALRPGVLARIGEIVGHDPILSMFAD